MKDVMTDSEFRAAAREAETRIWSRLHDMGWDAPPDLGANDHLWSDAEKDASMAQMRKVSGGAPALCAVLKVMSILFTATTRVSPTVCFTMLGVTPPALIQAKLDAAAAAIRDGAVAYTANVVGRALAEMCLSVLPELIDVSVVKVVSAGEDEDADDDDDEAEAAGGMPLHQLN